MNKVARARLVEMLLLVTMMSLTGCSFGAPAETTVTPTATLLAVTATVMPPAPTTTPTVVAPTNTASAPSPTVASTASPTATRTAIPPTATPLPPSATRTTIPATPTLPPTATPLPAASPTPAEMTVEISLIAIGDNGTSGPKIGCGDSAVPVHVRVPYTQGVLRAALDKLLSIKQRDYGQSGLYDVLYQSDLHLASVAIQNGIATIRLTGTLTLGGECDSPRVDAQIRYTALQFSTVQDVVIFVNDKPLADVLSLK